jgi:hypothetical protein
LLKYSSIRDKAMVKNEEPVINMADSM